MGRYQRIFPFFVYFKKHLFCKFFFRTFVINMNVLTLFVWYSIINLIVYLISIKLLMVLTNELRNSDCEFLHKVDTNYICYIPFINTVICVVLLPLLILLFITFWIIHKIR